MKTLLPALVLAATLFGAAPTFAAAPLSQQLAGKILLAVEDKGKTYYVNTDGKRYRVTQVTAFEIFKKLALGIANKDLAMIPEGGLGIDPETGAAIAVGNNTGSLQSAMAKQLNGKILLAVEDKGKTYYVHSDGKRYRVTRNTAFEIFKKLALGIANKDLATIAEGNLGIDAETGAALSVEPTYPVTKVVDGDTVDVNMGGTTERLRLIGINTPETVDPGKPVECFGIEASNRTKALLTGQSVRLEADPSQGERDKYGRLLRYVFVGGTNVNLSLIQDGYAYEYTYDDAYKYQVEFKAAQVAAESGKKGLWADGACGAASADAAVTDDGSSAPENPGSCVIKGNISSSSERIYHVPGCGSYGVTQIDESKGERWFCSEEEALGAGWRKALNCS